MKKLTSLTAFFPCYNEVANVPLFVAEAIKELPKFAQKFEIIVVDDGSKDGTSAVAKALSKQHPEVRLVSHVKNLGYGAAVRSGIKAAKMEWVFFTDGDLQFRLKELVEFVRAAENQDVVIGYRKHRADGGMRAFNAGLFKRYIDLLFRLHVRDIDCAFKLFKTSIVQSLKLESNGAFLSSELLYKLKKKGVHFSQLPVDHLPRKFGKPTGNNPKVIVKAGFDALKLYLHLKWQFLTQGY
jgi:glycosyltransferase involved in cell wall biosynthesis